LHDLISAVRGEAPAAKDDESIRELLRLLMLDHYLIREADGRYVFRYPLLLQWWKTDRML
jgi:hypothetical protein